MRSLLGFASKFVLSLSLATLAIVAMQARAAADCAFAQDPVAGKVRKADKCGFFGLGICTRRMTFDPITGKLLTDACTCG